MFGPLQNTAGRRTLSIPETIREDLHLHLGDHVADDPDALIPTGAKGAVQRRSGFQTQARWGLVCGTGDTSRGLIFTIYAIRAIRSRPAPAQPRGSHGADGSRLCRGRTDLPARRQQRDAMIADVLSLSTDVERDRHATGTTTPGEAP
jgi:hypothetical protein